MKKFSQLLTLKNKILLVSFFVVVALIAVAAAFLTYNKIYQKYNGGQLAREVVATVDDQELTVGQFVPYLKMSYDSLTQYLGSSVSLDTDMGDGTSVASYICYDALEAYRTYRIIETKAQELGITLSDEQEKALEADLENLTKKPQVRILIPIRTKPAATCSIQTYTTTTTAQAAVRSQPMRTL
jgi:hypothetical protein